MKYPRIFLFLLFSSGLSEPVLAHGARIDYQQTSAIVIRATYDDGTPMAEAQAVVYAPDDPTNPWLKGTTNEAGEFSFVPDPDLAGNWDVKVRQSGHGDIVSIPLDSGAIASEETSAMSSNANVAKSAGYSTGQKLLMAIAGIWGFIGTALFFARKPNNTVTENSHS
jgi:nickel transport protein